MPGALTSPRTENRACLRKVHFWRVLTSKPSDWFYTSWDSLLSQETLSEPFWSDSHIILFSSKHTFFICILLKSSYNKKPLQYKVYVLYFTHTDIRGKASTAVYSPWPGKKHQDPFKTTTPHTGFSCRTWRPTSSSEREKVEVLQTPFFSFNCRARATHATARFSPEKLKFCKLLFKTVIESLTINTLSLEVEVL